MARDVNALINKCENAITQEEKTISDAKEKIRKLRMPDTKELITKILYPSDDSKQESEYERNSRINNEIKRLAAINGEKPKYRMVAPELLDNIKQSGIQFAYFKKGDKYNIVFLRENEMKIDQLLKQFRKKN